LRQTPSDEESGGNDCEGSRDATALGRQVGEIGSQQRNGDLDRRIVDPAQYPIDPETDQPANGGAADRDQRQLKSRCRERELPCNHRDDPKPIGNQRDRVIDQAFPLENRDDAPGNFQALEDRSSGNGVRR